MYLVEGLEGGRWPSSTKTHHAMVDGVSAVDIGTVILDLTSEPRDTPVEPWDPAQQPSSLSLIAHAVVDSVRRPAAFVDNVRIGCST